MITQHFGLSELLGPVVSQYSVGRTCTDKRSEFYCYVSQDALFPSFTACVLAVCQCTYV